MENNRYEEVEKKENKFVAALKGFGKYLARVWKDFIASFRYNNMKLAGWLIAVPGIFIGFFLKWHAPTVKQLAFNYSTVVGEDIVTKSYIGFDFTGIALFVLMLAGILNIFGAASVMGKKNLGSVVRATIFTGIIVVCGALYLFAIFYYNSLVQKGIINVTTDGSAWSIWSDTNFVMAIISIIVSMVSAVAGCVIGFIKYDRTYEKVDR
jgi:hypothetical protein